MRVEPGVGADLTVGAHSDSASARSQAGVAGALARWLRRVRRGDLLLLGGQQHAPAGISSGGGVAAVPTGRADPGGSRVGSCAPCLREHVVRLAEVQPLAPAGKYPRAQRLRPAAYRVELSAAWPSATVKRRS